MTRNIPESLESITNLYGSVMETGIYPVPSIKEAETAKATESTQCALNIALINEINIILDCSNIDTLNVLEATQLRVDLSPIQT